jgi:hypothetical protein
MIACILALPFLALGTWAWIKAGFFHYQGPHGVELSGLGDAVFSIGAPLTLIVVHFPNYAGRLLGKHDDWWAIPAVNLLFLLQWLIWSQVAVFALRSCRRLLGAAR